MVTRIQQFIRDNDLGGEALLARDLLSAGKDPRSTQFTLAFEYGSDGAKSALFREAMGHTWLHLEYGMDYLVSKGHEEFTTELNRARREIEKTANSLGIER